MMIDREHSEDAFKPVRFLGKWWIPGSCEQLPGELVFNPTCRSTLEIVGELVPAFSDIAVIHGQTTDGTCITLFNSHVWEVNRAAGVGSPATSQKISVLDMWTGPRWFDSKADVAFQSYSFGIHDLANWSNQNRLSDSLNQNHLISTIACTMPPPIPLFDNERLVVSLTSQPVWSHGQDKGTIELFHRIGIRSKQGLLPYYGDTDSISECEWMIFILIALLMGCTTWKFGFAGKLPPSTDKADMPPENPVRHYVRTDWEAPKPIRETPSVELLFPYDSLGPQFPAIAAAFSKLFRVNASQIEVIFRFQCRERGFDAATLPILLFAFEQLEEDIFHAQNPADAKFIPYKTKLRTAFQEMRSVFPELEGIVATDLIDYLSETRNTFAHEAKATSDAFSRYVGVTVWMGDFLTLMVLRACGMSPDAIKTIYFRRFAPGNWKTEQLFKLFRH